MVESGEFILGVIGVFVFVSIVLSGILVVEIGSDVVSSLTYTHEFGSCEISDSVNLSTSLAQNKKYSLQKQSTLKIKKQNFEGKNKQKYCILNKKSNSNFKKISSIVPA